MGWLGRLFGVGTVYSFVGGDYLPAALGAYFTFAIGANAREEFKHESFMRGSDKRLRDLKEYRENLYRKYPELRNLRQEPGLRN